MSDIELKSCASSGDAQECFDYEPYNNSFEIDSCDLQIAELMGHGQFGDVYRGTLTISNSSDPEIVIVAVKTTKSAANFRERGMSEEEINKLLQNERCSLRDELKVMAHVGEHPNVLKLLGAITKYKVNFCIVTEFCELGSLDNFLSLKLEQHLFISEIINEEILSTSITKWKANRDPQWAENYTSRRDSGHITTSDLMWFALQIASAIEFLTKKQILHRDIALRNVLLKPDFVAKLADFGLARFVSSSEGGLSSTYTMQKNLTLPFRYFSPETLRTFRFTMQSECWTFGVVVWELFTFAREIPYSTECGMQNSFHVILKFLETGQRLTIPDCMPQNVRNLVEQLWDNDPSKRPSIRLCQKLFVTEISQSCHEMINEQTIIQDIKSLLDLDSSTTLTNIAAETCPHQCCRKRIVIILAIFAIAFFIALITAGWLLFIHSPELEKSIDDLVIIKMFAGVLGGYLMCVHPDGKSVFVLNTTDFVRIDLSTGNQFVFNQFLLDKSPNDTYKYLHSIFRSEKAFILALILDQSTEKYYLTSHLIGEQNTSIASRNGIDISMEPSKSEIVSGIIEDENGEIYCIITWYSNSYTTNFHAVKINFDKSGTITHNLLVSNRSLKGPYILPFIRSGASIWLKYTRDWSTLAGQQSVRQVPLNNARNNTDFGSDEKVSVSDHQNTTNMVLTSGLEDFPITMGDKIFYTFSASVSMEISLNYLDWKRRTWRILHFKAKEHLLELSFNSPNTTARSTADSKAYLHGDCGWNQQQVMVDKFCLYEIDLQAALKKEDDNFDRAATVVSQSHR